jgi:acyl-coenzyme A thioesterase PaaI-like protein
MSPTIMLRLFGLAKIPLLFLVGPKVLKLNDEQVEVRIPLNRITRNHLGSMYFGTLAIGVDCAGGLLAVHHIRQSGEKVSLVFKDFKADFLKRPEAAVVFKCRQGKEIKALVNKVIKTKARHHRTIKIDAYCGRIHVAAFELTISLKV